MDAGMMDVLPLDLCMHDFTVSCPLSDLDIEIVDQLKHCVITFHFYMHALSYIHLFTRVNCKLLSYYTDLIKLGAPSS